MAYHMEESKKIRTLVLIVFIAFSLGLLLSMPEYGLAQPGLPNGPEQTPIDGGLGILAALGGAYAIKKLRDKE